ncbi:hypothetical protein [Peribacillus acanthi]|uniref:hypothetical protein n=1 Tax=Peribacillus acanthi TaxID=2171554 RepID=UPI000D3E28FA|nr:hypothetical protein [Peribacillus acanthi]
MNGVRFLSNIARGMGGNENEIQNKKALSNCLAGRCLRPCNSWGVPTNCPNISIPLFNEIAKNQFKKELF